ncbi:MAG: type III secretion system chaperone [Desulfovibrionales bacterium]|nr:type III secretion system chaperone [Desulfovibrionales bacterium]
MDSSERNIALAKQQVGKFAQKHGLSGFEMSDEGEAVLDLDGVEIFFYADLEVPALHITAPLMTISDEDKEFESHLEAAMELNLFPEKFDDARFAYVRDMGTFVLCKRISLLSLPEGALDVPLGLFFEALQTGLGVFAEKEGHSAGTAAKA